MAQDSIALKDIVTTSISVISLGISLFALYITNFQSPNISVLIGNTLTIFNSYVDTQKGREWGGVAFYLPITFYNWNQTGGSIYLVRLIFGQENPATKYFDIIWSNFTKIKDGKWENEDLAQPIAIPGKGSVNKLIRFDWNPLLTKERIKLKEGNYKLMIFIWTNKSRRPAKKEIMNLYVSNENAHDFDFFVENNMNAPIFISTEETALPNNILSLDNIKNLYL